MIYEPSIRVFTVGDEIRVQPVGVEQAAFWENWHYGPWERFYNRALMERFRYGEKF